MYSLLIVDDEKWVRQGLKMTIDWKSYGIELWGEAENGEDACAWLSASKPDIMIADIKMPGMDGLSLLEHIKRNKLPTKVIIISGYGEFQYAQKAMKCGAYGYVLKPVEEQNLLEIVQRCVEDLDNDHRQALAIEEMRGTIRESMPLARQRYLEQYLLGDTEPSVPRAETTWRALQLHLDPDNIQVALARIHDWGGSGKTRSDRSSMLYALGNITEELLKNGGFSSVCCTLSDTGDADLAVVLSPKPGVAHRAHREHHGHDDCHTHPEHHGHHASRPRIHPAHTHACKEDAISVLFQRVLAEASELLHITASIGVSRVCGWNELSRAYIEAAYCCSQSFAHGHGKLYDGSRVSMKCIDIGIPYLGPSTDWENRIIHAIKAGDGSLLEQNVKELEAHLKQSVQKYNMLQLTRGLRLLLSNLLYKLKSCFADGELPEAGFSKDISIHSLKLDGLSRQLLAEIQKWSLQIRGTVNRRKVVELGLEYIAEHFTEQITLQDLSNHLYVNASYFSKIFHEEVGETFVRYVAGLRIMKAKRLLEETTKKIYEISEEVGYKDFRHFVKTFKDIVGLTPSQYRDMGRT